MSDQDLQSAREEALTAAVLASFDGAASPRVRELLRSLVGHLHAVVRETRLTEAEWQEAVDFLTACGRLSDDRRQEVILLSDVLGVSMQTVAVNNEAYADATEATVVGPFFREESPYVPSGGDLAAGAPGEPCWVTGSVRDTDGTPLPGARVEVWEADEEGRYDVQYGDDRVSARGWLRTDDEGRFAFWGVTPTPYPIPDDGPVGRLLGAAGRSPMRASHLHFRVSAPGRRTLVTHIFVRGCPYLDRDSVFGVRDSLVRDFTRSPAGTPTPDGRVMAGTWTSADFDVVLAPA